MATEVVLPRLGLTQEEGTVVRWIKPEGSTVKKGEPLFEVMTDKATLEVEAPASGVLLRILVAEGGTVPVATPIALIGEPGEALPVIPAPGPVPEAGEGRRFFRFAVCALSAFRREQSNNYISPSHSKSYL